MTPDGDERRQAFLEDNAIYHNYTYINTFDLDGTKACNSPSTSAYIKHKIYPLLSTKQVLIEISHSRNRNTSNSKVVEMRR